MSIRVWLERRRSGAHKICPECSTRNRASGTKCKSCHGALKDVKRSYDGKPVYLLRWFDPHTGQERCKSVGSDKAHAKPLESKKLQKLTLGVETEITEISYDDFMKEHLETVKNSKAPTTYEESERAMRQFQEACHPKKLTSIDFKMLEQFRSARVADGVAPATVNKCLRQLQSALSAAVRRNYLKSNPFTGNRKALFLDEPEPRISVMEPHEFQSLLKACPNERWQGIVIIAYHAGLRSKEITGLQWSDVDFKNSILHVRNNEHRNTKNKRNRLIPMSAEIVEILKKIQKNKGNSKYIFTNPFQPSQPIKWNVCRDFARIIVRAGLVDENKKPLYTLHSLRKTFVTEMLSIGSDPKVLQSMTGHQDLDTLFRHYAAVRAKKAAADIDKRSRYLNGE